MARGPGAVTASPGRSGTPGSAWSTPAATGATPGRIGKTALFGGGTLGNASTPDDVAYDWGPAGFRVDMHVQLDNWYPDLTHWFTSQGDHLVGLDLSFAFSIHANGHFRTAITADGSTIQGTECPVPVPWGPNTPMDAWIRVDCFPSFAGQAHYTHYLSPDGIHWDILGVSPSEGAITLFNSTAPILCPGFVSERRQTTFEARYYRAVLFGGTKVAHPRFDTISPRVTGFTDEHARAWTINSPALIGVAA